MDMQQRVTYIMELADAIHERVGMITIVKDVEVDPYPQGVMVTVETTNGQTTKTPLPWDIRPGDAIYTIRNVAKMAYALNA